MKIFNANRRKDDLLGNFYFKIVSKKIVISVWVDEGDFEIVSGGSCLSNCVGCIS